MSYHYIFTPKFFSTNNVKVKSFDSRWAAIFYGCYRMITDRYMVGYTIIELRKEVITNE